MDFQPFLSFTEALELYLSSRELASNRPEGCRAYNDATRDQQLAAQHMNYYTKSGEFECAQ